nr:MAG TPA: Fusion protein of Lmo4 protein-tandem zipper, LIM domain, fusion.3A [Caudoviricetes sp.]
MDVSEIITEEERYVLLNDMEQLLSEYDYKFTGYALNKIIDTWATNKADLIKAFKRHPNYLEGKFMIVFSHEFERKTDQNAFEKFKIWLLFYAFNAVREFMPEDMKDEVVSGGKKYPDAVYEFILDLPNMTNQYIDDNIVEKLNEINPNLHAHNGQKMSRVINKFCSWICFDKLPDYNREFAKYADALNPLTITRHTVLSVNPLDYLTMSFGNSWASCHTIDKRNKRGMPNSYEGMYSSGTISYMLDSPSMVFYTVDASYNGNDFWNEPKINRQMFHWGEEKLVQGRLYPQDNDGDNSVYTPYREIVQKVMSELFSLPNYWTVSKGTDAAGKFINSDGTHYRDYDNYSNCTLSRPKGSENDRYITVGHDPICIECGSEHDTEDCISCCSRPSEYYCSECGEPIDDDDVIWINDEPYCRDCVTWCEECKSYFVGEGTNVISRYGYTITVCDDCLDSYTYCDCCDKYHPSEMTYWIDVDCESVCGDCFFENYGTCESCGEHYKLKDLEDHNGNLLCPSCLEDAIDKESEMEEAV